MSARCKIPFPAPADPRSARRRPHTVIAALVALALLAPRAVAEIRAGDAFPQLRSADLAEGRVPEVSGRVVVVDFWASWCAPCKASFPFYSSLSSEFGPSGLVILGISVDQDPRAYRSFVGRLNPSFAVVLDRDQKLVSLVQVPTMPTCYVVDRKGRVRYVHPGFHGSDTERELRGEVAALLAERMP